MARTSSPAPTVNPGAPQRSKPPYVTVIADNLVITRGGVDYYPHAGESVVFRGKLTLDAYLMSMQLSAVVGADISDAPPEVQEAVKQALIQVTEQLAKTIVKWGWTGDDERPLPSPPTAEVIREQLELEEILWLVDASYSGFQTDRGNG